jgi:hypothetical protein
MTPKFIISLERAPDYAPHYVAESGVIAAGDANRNFDKAKKFDTGPEAEAFAKKHYPEWSRITNYCGVWFQEEFARSKSVEVAG